MGGKLVTQYGPDSDHVKHFGELGTSFSDGTIPSPLAFADTIARHAVDTVQAHSTAIGFFTAAMFAAAGVIVTVFGINVKKSDLPTGSDAGTPVDGRHQCRPGVMCSIGGVVDAGASGAVTPLSP